VIINPDVGDVEISPLTGSLILSPVASDTEVRLSVGGSVIVRDSAYAPVLEVSDDQSNGNRVTVYDRGGNKIWEIHEDGSLHGKTGQSLTFDL
jgi:hypothetical protein